MEDKPLPEWTFQHALKRLLARGLTKKALADAAGADPSQVTRWEAGSTPDTTAIMGIAQAWGVSVEWLLAGREPMDYMPPDARAVAVDGTLATVAAALDRFRGMDFEAPPLGKGPKKRPVISPAASAGGSQPRTAARTARGVPGRPVDRIQEKPRKAGGRKGRKE